MTILILVALPKEIGNVNLSTPDVDVVFTGIGKLNAYQATRTALRTRHYDFIINVGTAGSASYPIGTVLYPTVVKQGDFFLTEESPETIECTNKKLHTILTQDNFVSFGKDFLGNVEVPEEYRGIDCFDMEAFAIAKAAEFMKERVHFIKIVSDNLDGSVKDWEKTLQSISPKLVKAVYEYINNVIGLHYESAAIY